MSDEQEVIRLIKIGFDSMENQLGNAIYEKEIASFAEVGGGDVAHLLCANFISAMPLEKLYLGWDGEIYPKFIIKKTRSI